MATPNAGLLSFAMATRNAANMPGRPEKCTEFQLHAGKNRARNVVDFTEYRLMKYIEKTSDLQQRAILTALIQDYRNGLVAVAWRRGYPVPVRVTKEA